MYHLSELLLICGALECISRCLTLTDSSAELICGAV